SPKFSDANKLMGPAVSLDLTHKRKKLAVIAHLESNKALGPDGFPKEQYKVMRESLIPVLQSTFNWVLEGDEIPVSSREGVISPVSVLNQDSKNSLLSRNLSSHLHQTFMTEQLDRSHSI
uniref:Uncharacterized protein n=1 Tax=Stegastes partitus TaxID=144197 RepID=A0A3B5A0S8_9TELE